MRGIHEAFLDNDVLSEEVDACGARSLVGDVGALHHPLK